NTCSPPPIWLNRGAINERCVPEIQFQLGMTFLVGTANANDPAADEVAGSGGHRISSPNSGRSATTNLSTCASSAGVTCLLRSECTALMRTLWFLRMSSRCASRYLGCVRALY